MGGPGDGRGALRRAWPREGGVQPGLCVLRDPALKDWTARGLFYTKVIQGRTSRRRKQKPARGCSSGRGNQETGLPRPPALPLPGHTVFPEPLKLALSELRAQQLMKPQRQRAAACAWLAHGSHAGQQGRRAAAERPQATQPLRGFSREPQVIPKSLLRPA